MARSNATTVDTYLAELPEDRRAVMQAMVDLIRRNVPEGYSEIMSFGMACWGIPLERYPNTYNKQPLCYLALAAQKNYYALYLMSAYQDSEQERWLREAFTAAGRKLDMGKSCLRFRKLEDLPLDVIAKVVASQAPDAFIATYEAAHAGR